MNTSVLMDTLVGLFETSVSHLEKRGVFFFSVLVKYLHEAQLHAGSTPASEIQAKKCAQVAQRDILMICRIQCGSSLVNK